MPSYYNDLVDEEQDWTDVILKRPDEMNKSSEESIKLHFGKYIIQGRLFDNWEKCNLAILRPDSESRQQNHV